MVFYRCEHCGNIIAHINDSGVRCVCCGEEMKPIVPNTSDGAGEKHVPVIAVDGRTVTVTVGSVEHPMQDAHYIMWIILETKHGMTDVTINVEAEPGVTGHMVAKHLRERLGFLPKGDVFPVGALPRTEGKAKRVIRRKVD